MLREAIWSVLKNSTHKDVLCWVLDDGSDFDATLVLEEFQDDRLIVVKGEHPTPEQRVKDSSRFVNNVNSVLEQMVPEEFVLFLCDDDVIGPRYIELSSTFLEGNPHLHFTSGDAFYFYDGENPYVDGKKGFKAPQVAIDAILQRRDGVQFWHVGNFAHRTECFLDEGLKWRSKDWGDKTAHSWDVDYIVDLNKLHATHVVLKIPALYRREHQNMLSYRLGRLNGDPMSEETTYTMEPKELTEDMVLGMME